MIILPIKLLSGSTDNQSPLMANNTKQYIPIPAHSYPIIILLFWGIVSVVFCVNLFVSCIWYAPLHLDASRTIETINRLVSNKQYFQALQLHKNLCNAYPNRYVNSYGVEIAKVCFLCSQHKPSFFKKGLRYLQGKTLDTENFSMLYQKIPSRFKETYVGLFDVMYREKSSEKDYRFILNDDRVKLL